MVEYLQRWLGGRTLVLSTHKRTLLALVQRAVVLRQGQVAMDGGLEQVVQERQVTLPQSVEGGAHGH
ncbi:MAG: hypothetical protein GAK45_00051 [Pseudomonas citronellolis]|nr:MAG: hypothetical protein GAK45_00051 [Pseudomonas citronellolis]